MRLDNTTAIAYINKAGGVQYQKLSELARQIWQWCESRKVWIMASYITLEANVEGDKASRITNTDTEWELANCVYKRIVCSFGSHSIDLFVSRLNTKCKRFCSRFQDPESEVVDAFTISWKKEDLYAFPPFALILPTLRKIINDRATGTMVVSKWSTQPWYPLFTSLIKEPVLYFEPSQEILISPCSSLSHPLAKNLTLVAARLSGKPS